MQFIQIFFYAVLFYNLGMILFASGRTDIPAFYSEWFINRIKAGFVDVRNPYCQEKVTRYELNPRVVDCIVFCTKNPKPLLPFLEELKDFKIYFFVTITPYGKDIELNVPEKGAVIESFKELSRKIGKEKVCWRYDPIFIDSFYSVAFHIRAFKKLCTLLSPFTDRCVISFVDLYEKVKKNFPELKEVCEEDQKFIAGSFSRIADEYGLSIESCAEKLDMSSYGVKAGECVSKELMEKLTSSRLLFTGKQVLRQNCTCLPMRDIAHYNSCPHLCRYCYANFSEKTVQKNYALHDPSSSFLIGNSKAGDIVTKAKQESFRDPQLYFL